MMLRKYFLDISLKLIHNFKIEIIFENIKIIFTLRTHILIFIYRKANESKGFTYYKNKKS